MEGSSIDWMLNMNQAKEGRVKEFETALKILRGKDVDVSQEAAEIQDYITSLEQLPKPNLTDLFRRMYLRSVIIGVGLMLCQQFGGLNGISFYLANIFELAGFSAKVGTIAYAILQIIVVILGVFLIDKAGRKPLILYLPRGWSSVVPSPVYHFVSRKMKWQSRQFQY